MQKRQLSKQQRRKRKDPQSRDFQCSQCQKSYLSYAAAYTHVKNKHKHIKDLQQTIIKPQKQKLKRGRPKDKKQIILSNQNQQLSICEQTTLFIYQQLKNIQKKFEHHIILEGNQQMNKQKYQEQYEKLLKNQLLQIDILNINKFNGEKGQSKQSKNRNKQQQNEKNKQQQQIRTFEKFTSGVIKHFRAEIAVRFVYCVNFLLGIYHEGLGEKQKAEQKIQQMNMMDLWEGRNQAMCKWTQLVRKQQNDQ